MQAPLDIAGLFYTGSIYHLFRVNCNNK